MADVPQANPNGLMTIGAVAAHNIAALLNLDVSHVGTIEQAIKDEINAMSSHFTLAIADVNTQYEASIAQAKIRETEAIAAFNAKVAEIKSTFTFVKANKPGIVAAAGILLCVGAVVGFVFRSLF